ncbi:EI24 domain-containing protein [Pseudorhodoferax sp. Leaf267]|uniref:EI24 domain-containing protein n=1 Tax=Pseudorhodoferax sp. Leaf267 TaxID=1736316 RepID=UPI0009E95AEA|nr:EI24 domain-containing protein [Pseudorhodoferax sp. Leaf267]
MRLLLDSFWRAAAYCLHPRVIALSLLPLVLIAGLALGLGYFFWESTIAFTRAWLESWPVFGTAMGWLQGFGWGNVQGLIAPLLVVALITPLIVVISLLLVAALMTPSIVALVGERRFPKMDKRHGGSFFGSLFGALWATIAALVVLVLSIPLWLIPPLVLVLPPLIWGWLTYRVMAYDVLADYASRPERQAIMREHRVNLLVLGILTGYLGAAPALIWAWGALAVVLAPVLVPLAVWVYTLVFAFSALWFTHYALAALEAMRAREAAVQVVPPSADWPQPSAVLIEPGASSSSSSTRPYEPAPLPPP